MRVRVCVCERAWDWIKRVNSQIPVELSKFFNTNNILNEVYIIVYLVIAKCLFTALRIFSEINSPFEVVSENLLINSSDLQFIYKMFLEKFST